MPVQFTIVIYTEATGNTVMSFPIDFYVCRVYMSSIRIIDCHHAPVFHIGANTIVDAVGTIDEIRRTKLCKHTGEGNTPAKGITVIVLIKKAGGPVPSPIFGNSGDGGTG